MSAPIKNLNSIFGDISRSRHAKTVGAAAKLFKLWHQKLPTDVEDIDYPLEDISVFRAGYLDCITYFSDKWEDDGDCYDYVHECDSRPSVFMEEGGAGLCYFVMRGDSSHGPFTLDEMLENNAEQEQVCAALEAMQPGDDLSIGDYRIFCYPGLPGDPSELLATNVAHNATHAMPILAGVKELIVVEDSGQQRCIRFRTLPKLLLCHDKKGLLVLSGELGPIYIRGGKMHVTDRGIHR